MDDRDLYLALLETARRLQPLALATVVRVKGSTPRRVGSKMLIDGEGRAVGTIGGGCGEAEVLEAAQEVMRSGTPRVVRVDLTEDALSWSPAICGGVMDVFVEPVHASDAGGEPRGPRGRSSRSGRSGRGSDRAAAG
ncbi:MAG: XdhC family protein [Gemmatimonadetes bacterium]|nr:XdhC family protein [Gemmatimonadota bacterium]